MTGKEVKVYLSKQIMMCEEKIELYENVKASKDFIELHKNLLDFYKTIEKDLEILEILLASFIKKSITNGTDSNKMILLDSESYNKIKELLENERNKN